MDEKEWLMKPPSNWRCEAVVDAMLRVDEYDASTIGEALAPLDEYVASLEQENQRLRGLLERSDKLFDDLVDHHCSGMCDYAWKGEESEHLKLMNKTSDLQAELAAELGEPPAPDYHGEGVA
jgi:hypothetical protein